MRRARLTTRLSYTTDWDATEVTGLAARRGRRCWGCGRRLL